MNKTRQNKRGFTLIEMLLVIVIIAILVALLFPAIKQALLRAEIAKAKTTVLSIATAFKAFNSQYGYWPNGADDLSSPQDLKTDYLTSTYGNSLNITFLDYSSKDVDSSNHILDPWKKPYKIALDTKYINSVATNCSGSSSTISGGVAVWSLGPDGSCGTSDDVTSW